MDFKDKKIVITGTFECMTRKEAQEKLKGLGANITGSISKNTDVLVAGAAAGSKLMKAEKLGTTIVTESELLEILGIETSSENQLTGPLYDFKERFMKLVKELREHPDIDVLHYNLGKPASDTKIEQVEDYLGTELTPAIKNFYKQCDGASLMWVYKDTEGKENVRIRPNNRYALEDNGICEGCMNIFPIVDTFKKNIWRGHHYWTDDDWKESNEKPQEFMDKEGLTRLSFAQSIKIFDYHYFYQMMAFFVEKGNGNPPVLMGDDHGACWTDSYVTDFESYIEMTLANSAHRDSRSRLFSKYNAHTEGLKVIPKSYWTKDNSFDLTKRSFGDFKENSFFE